MDRKEKFQEFTGIIDQKGEIKYLPLYDKAAGIKFHLAENKYSIQDYYDYDVQPIMNIGMLIPDYYCVIDIDFHNGSDVGYMNMSKLVDKFGDLPNTLLINTPNFGMHFVFKVDPTKMHKYQKGKLAEQVDFLYGKNTYIACVSSINFKTGKIYELAKSNKKFSTEIAELPENWYNAIPSKETKSKSKNKKLKKQPIQPSTNPNYEEPSTEIKEIIQYAFDSAIGKKGKFEDGNRFYGLQSFAGSCNSYGVPEHYSIQFAETNIGGACNSIISGIYEKYNDQFDTKSFNDRKNKATEFDYNQLVPTEKKRSKANNYLKLKNNRIYRPSQFLVKKLMIISPPNTGKTYYSMNSLPKEDHKKQYIYAFPTRSLGLQKAEEAGISFVYEGISPDFQSKKIATTFDSLGKFFNNDRFKPDNYILVIDEVHNIISTNTYRAKIMKKMKRYFDGFYRVIALTATPIESPIFDEFEVFCFESENDTDKYDIIFCKDKTKSLEKYLIKGKTNFIFLNGKEKSEEISKGLEQQGYTTLLLNKETVEAPSAISLVTDSKFDQHYDVVFLTSFWAEGVDIYDCEIGNFIFYYFNGIIPPVTVKQVIHRVRDTKPINIFLFLTHDKNKKYDLNKVYDPEIININNTDFANQMINSWNNLSSKEKYNKDVNVFLMKFVGTTKDLFVYDSLNNILTLDSYQIEASVYNERQNIMENNPQEYINRLAEFGLIYNTFKIELNELSNDEKKQRSLERQIKKEEKEKKQISIIHHLISERREMQIEEFKEIKEVDLETNDLKRKIIIIFERISNYNLISRVVAKYESVDIFVCDLMKRCLNNDSKFKITLLQLQVLNFRYNDDEIDNSAFLNGMFNEFKIDVGFTTVEIQEKIISLARIDERVQIFDISYEFKDLKKKQLEILRYFFDDTKTTIRVKEGDKTHMSCYYFKPIL
jgi:hypothetical protein